MIANHDTLMLRCRTRDKDKTLTKGEVYEVVLVDEGTVSINDKTYPRKLFADSDSLTGDSAQGLTIRDPYCVFQVDHRFAGPQWFWTALTRCTRISDVWIYTGTELAAEVSDVWKVLQCRLNGYIRQDGFTKTSLPTGYLNTASMMKRVTDQHQRCASCSRLVELDAVSFNRRCNELPHLDSNVDLTCLSCNQGYRPTSDTNS